MAGKKYVYIGNAPEVEVLGVGIVRQNETFSYTGDLNNPDFEESRAKTKPQEEKVEESKE